MAERPKTTAEQTYTEAEITDIISNQSILIKQLNDQITDLKVFANDISQRLRWIVGLVRSKITIGVDTERAIEELDDLYANALRIGDILNGNADTEPAVNSDEA